MAQKVNQETLQANEARKQEVKGFMADLNGFNLTIDEVIKASPKKWQDREKAKRIAKFVAGSSEQKEYLYNNHELPYDKIETQMNIGRGFLEDNENYIAALVLIQASDNEKLKEYIKLWGEEA